MHDVTFPQSGSKRKLLDVAEQLFAENGFEAVSVRDITQLAKANVASVNYYFGSREALLAMVMARHLVPVSEERLAKLDLIEKRWAGKLPPLEELIDAMVQPLLGQVKKSDLSERLFYKLMGRIFAQQGDGLPPAIENQLTRTNDRFTRAFGKALSSLSAEDLALRIHFVTGGLIQILSKQDVMQGPSGGACSMEATLERFIRFASAGLREGIEVTDKATKSPQAIFDF